MKNSSEAMQSLHKAISAAIYHSSTNGSRRCVVYTAHDKTFSFLDKISKGYAISPSHCRRYQITLSTDEVCKVCSEFKKEGFYCGWAVITDIGYKTAYTFEIMWGTSNQKKEECFSIKTVKPEVKIVKTEKRLPPVFKCNR